MTISQRTFIILLMLTVAPARVALSQEASAPSGSIGVPGKVREELAHADRATSAMPTTDDALAVRDVRPSMDAGLIRSIRPDWRIGQDADAVQPEIADFPEVRFAQITFAEMAALEASRDVTPAQESEVESLLAPPLLTSFAGTADNLTSFPPDTHGAVGPNHVAELLNNGWQVFDKTGGVVVALVSHQSFWSALGTGPGAPAEFVFDPRIIYDQHSGRWLATADSNPNTAGNVSWVLVGISMTSDPTGTWNLFAIDADATSPGEWADFPDLGVDVDNVYVTNNMFAVSASPSFTTAKFWVISKASMISGGPLSVKEFINGVGGSTYRACHSYDATAGGFNYLVDQGWSDGGTARFLRIQRITGIGAAAVLTDLGFIEVATYNFSQSDAPQPMCSTEIDSGGGRLRNAVMRNAKIWTTHSVGNASTKPEVAWYEFDPTTATSFGPFVMAIQQGRVADSSLNYYYPSIAVNKDECVALGFSGSDAGTFVSGYYTLRLPTDPAGTMQPVNLLKAGEDTYWKQGSGTRNRWGDYSATVVDPVDDETFWTVQEYAMQQLPAGRLDVNTPPSIAGTYNAPPASFGPPLTETGITGDVALAEPNEACSAITNPGAVSGKVALVDRGSCFFSTKVKNCQDAGAIAVIVANNVPDPPLRMAAGTGDVITIPSVMVSQIDGATIRTEVSGGSTVNVRLYIVEPTVCESGGGRWATWWGAFTCGPFCGDGLITDAEECDDGNASNNDDCLNDCTAADCGDSFVWNEGSGTEACDDGNASNNDDCLNDCTAAGCGDSFVWNEGSGMEACDDGGESATCDADCTGVECGDDTLNVSAGEECDGMDDTACPGACQADCTCIVAPDPLEACPNPWTPDPEGGKLNRTGCFEMPASAVAAGEQTTIRVRMVDLYVDSIEDPVNGCPVRTEGNDLSAFENQVRYLGPPSALDDNDVLVTPKFIAAELQCTPFVRDWTPAALAVEFPGADTSRIYYYGKEVFPCSLHDAQQATQTCVESASESCFSTSLEIRTALWGDVWTPFGGPGQPTFTDIGKVVDAFKSIPFVEGPPPSGAPRKVRAMLRGNSVPLDSSVSFTDIGLCVDAFKTIPYKEDGPTACIAGTVEVTTIGLTFVPPDVTIQAGDSIHFTGLVGGFHTVAEVDDNTATSWNGGFHSPPGASEFTQVFNSAGVFHYICEPHVFSGMRGKITVTAAQ